MTESERNPWRRGASVKSIRDVAGPVTDATVAELLDIGATEEELEVASALARGEGDLVFRKHYTLTSRIHRIFNVLTSGPAARLRQH